MKHATITIGVKTNYRSNTTKVRAYIAGVLIKLAEKIAKTTIKVEFVDLTDDTSRS